MAQPPNPNSPFTVDYPRSTDDILRSLQRAYERLNSLQQQILNLPQSQLTPGQLAQVKSLIGPTANQQLSVGGSNPLFITNITGGTSLANILAGTHTNRIVNVNPANTTGATIYFETDRTVYYQIVNGQWFYTAGKMEAILASLPGDLGTGDAGFLFYATDYYHTYLWDGSAWGYAPGDEGSGFIRHFTVAPRTGKWQLCDGSAGVTESLANGTTQLVAFSGLAAGTMPDLITTPTYLRFNSTCTGVVNAATAPTFTGTPATLTGTISTPTLTMNSYTPAGSVGATFLGNGLTVTSGSTYTVTGAATALTSIGGVSSGVITPTGTIIAAFNGTPATLTGTISTPTLTMNSYTPAGTISSTAQPRNMDTLPYYRL